MNLAEKLDKALGAGQSTKGPGQVSTGPKLGATKGSEINKSKNDTAKISKTPQ